MNRLPWTVLVGVVVAALIFSCGDDAGDVLTVTDRGATFDVAVGERFSIVLESNPSTGYAWAVEEPVPDQVLRLVDDLYHADESGLVGGGGLQELVFEGVGDGSIDLGLWYVRPFDDPPEPADQARFEVVVGAGSP
ncbi:MAG: protease inhibitor I42 family protein [Acidimicrobiia bacterium]|nr:protease inhibitor I42 family protein [Acidimicrobiia bacterium]